MVMIQGRQSLQILSYKYFNMCRRDYTVSFKRPRKFVSEIISISLKARAHTHTVRDVYSLQSFQFGYTLDM